MKNESFIELRKVLNSDLPVLISFYYVSDFTRQNMIEILSSVKRITGNMVCILKIKINKDDILSEIYKLEAPNTLILFHKGEICWRKSGLISKTEILREIALHC
jgi:thioredoxin 1